MRLHLRHPGDKRKTRCGRPLKGSGLSKVSTPAGERCQRCEDSWDKEQAEFKELAELIQDAWWQMTGKLW